MGWLGAITGGVLGGMFGGPIGAAIGASIGACMGASDDANIKKTAGCDSAEERQAIFITALFSCLAKIAKADGVVSADEAAYIKKMISDQFDPAQKNYIQHVFNNAKNNSVPIEDYLRQLNLMANGDMEFKQGFLAVLCELAMCDGVKPPEYAMLLKAERIFGFHGFVDAALHSRGNSSSGGREQKQYAHSDEKTDNDLTSSYQILGLTMECSAEELKAAYRKKCLAFHPDTIQAKGLPPEFIEFAHNEMQKINLAYNNIRKERNL